MIDRSARRLALAAISAGCLLAAGPALASTSGWNTSADFSAGSFSSALVEADSVVIDTTGVGRPDASIPWWDASWGQRRCVTVTNNEAVSLTEYQVVVDIDTVTPISGGRMRPTGADLRAVASDGSTLLDLWIEGPLDSAATRVWVQTDTLPPGDSDLCLYYDNPGAATVSDPIAPFTYASPRPLYVAVAANQAGRDLAVVSYGDDNVVSDGTTTSTLAAGVPTVFPGASHTAETVVTATGPLALRGLGSAVDTYVPIAFADTEFVIPTSRSTNRLSFHAPFATADVTVDHSGTVTLVTVPAGTSVTVTADIVSSADAAIVTSNAPVLVAHTASGTTDAYVAVPASDERLFGIRSTQHLTGIGQDGTVAAVTESDGGSVGVSGGRGDQVVRTGGGSQGTGPAVIVVPSAGGSIAAIQQADSDGGESSAYWPESELNVVSRVATLSQYVAISCPEQATANVAVAGVPADCTGVGGASYPGKARATSVAAGALIESLDGRPFHVYAEDQASNDEANVLGPKQARLNTTNPPTVVIGPEESPYELSGTWTSPTVDTGCSPFLDLIRWNPPSQPAGVSLTMQIASSATAGGPFVPVGPDGTGASSYTDPAGQAVAGVHDGDRFFRVVAALTTADTVVTPRLDDVAVDWVGSATVRGTVFRDADVDGVLGGTDVGIGGVPVALWLDDGDGSFDPGADVTVATGTSAPDGTYVFSNQRPGTYFVSADEDALDRTNLIGSTTGNPPPSATAGECAETVVDLGWEFGARVAASVFSDTDADGSPGPSDPGIEGVPTQLWLDDGDGSFDRLSDTLLSTVATNGSGSADFGTVGEGTYFVLVGGGDTPTGHLAPASTQNPAGPIAIIAAGGGATPAIGFVPEGDIVGAVGGAPSGTPTLPDVFVSLFLDDGDGVFEPDVDGLVSTTLSGTDGRYRFGALAAGDHWVVPGPPPTGYAEAPRVSVDVAPGSTEIADLLFPPAGSIAGRVTADDDGVDDALTMPLGGVRLTLHRDDGDGVFDPSDDIRIASTVSAGDGGFTFGGVGPGGHFVVADLGEGLLATLTQISSPNPVGPVTAGDTDVLFVADPIDLTLPETGGESRRLIGLGVVLLLGGGLLRLAASRRGRTIVPEPA